MSSFSGKVVRALRQLAAEEPLRVQVTGQCMSPLLSEGAEVEVERRSFYWPGDVIAFRAGDDRLLIHRVIGVSMRHRRLRLVTQADSKTGPDGSVGLDQVIGKVCGGQCPDELVHIPLAQRVASVGRFLRAAFRRLVRL